MQKFPADIKTIPLLGLFLGLILIARLISLYFNNNELFFDEAQYWYWAQEPAFGYFSKPPVLAWIIHATTAVCGSDSAFCIRLASPLLHTLTALMIYLSTVELIDRRTGFWAAMIFATLPGISLSATIISTDVPLLLFWSITLYAYIRMTKHDHFKWVLLFGVALGMGLMSKYAMAFFVGCAIIHALLERSRSHPVAGYRFWLGCLIGLLILVPNIYWNMQNAFVTVSHTGDNIGWRGSGLHFDKAAEFIGSQFGVFGPVLFGLYLAILWAARKGNIPASHRLLIAFSLPVFVVIVAQALMRQAYANWAATMYIAACILVADFLVNRIPRIWLRCSTGLHLGVFGVLAVIVCFAEPGQIKAPFADRLFERNQGSGEVGRRIVAMLEADNYKAVLTSSRKLSALMSYHLRARQEPVLAWRTNKIPGDHYQLVSAYQTSGIGPVLLIGKNPQPEKIISQFAIRQSLGEQNINIGKFKSLYFFKLDNYEGPIAER